MKGAPAKRYMLPPEDRPEPADLEALSEAGQTTDGLAAKPEVGRNPVRDVFLWLRQIARDPGLSPLAYRLAIEISQHIDRRKGYAYPSHLKLASDLDVSRRGVQLAIKQLQDREHLNIKVSRGAGHANQYRLRLDRCSQKAT